MKHRRGQTLLSLMLAGVLTAVLLAACVQFFVVLTRTFSEERGRRHFHHQVLLADRFLSGLKRNIAAGAPVVSGDDLQRSARWEHGDLSLRQAVDGRGRLTWRGSAGSGRAKASAVVLVDPVDFDLSTMDETVATLGLNLQYRGQSWTLRLLPVPEYLRDVTFNRK